MSVIMFFAVTAIGNIMHESSIVIVLIVQIFVGGLTYALLSVTVFRSYRKPANKPYPLVVLSSVFCVVR